MAIRVEAIRIDWKKAVDECDKALMRGCNLRKKLGNTCSKILSNPPDDSNIYENPQVIDFNAAMDTNMYLASLSCRIKNMYQNDDVDGYLELLDDNRAILKG